MRPFSLRQACYSLLISLLSLASIPPADAASTTYTLDFEDANIAWGPDHFGTPVTDYYNASKHIFFPIGYAVGTNAAITANVVRYHQDPQGSRTNQVLSTMTCAKSTQPNGDAYSCLEYSSLDAVFTFDHLKQKV